MIEFEWDIKKSSQNELKHNISFIEAITVFDDPFARIVDDDLHSEAEDRFQIIGKT